MVKPVTGPGHPLGRQGGRHTRGGDRVWWDAADRADQCRRHPGSLVGRHNRRQFERPRSGGADSPGEPRRIAATTPPPAPSETVQAQAPAAQLPTMPVVKPKVQSVSETMEVTGNAAAVSAGEAASRALSAISNRSTSRMARLAKKGDLLFTIQQDQYKAQLQQAQAQLQLAAGGAALCQDRGRPIYGIAEARCGDAGRCRSLELRASQRRGEHPGGAGADRAGATEHELYRGQGAVRRPDGQASDRCGQRGRRQRPAGRACRNHTARSDLRGGQHQLTAGAADPRQSGSAAAYLGRTASGPGRGRVVG